MLLVIAVACLSWYGWRTLEIRLEERAATKAIRDALAHPPAAEPASPVPSTGAAPPPPPGSLIGELVIPRLHLSAPVKTGDDDGVLDFSVGYLPDTPPPWNPGNSAMAAHRDRLFRPLEHIRQGDEIDLSTTHGRFRYRVLKTLIVAPRDVWVLDPLPKVNLTLITCYPFYYVGHAPRRFIVQAEKVETL